MDHSSLLTVSDNPRKLLHSLATILSGTSKDRLHLALDRNVKDLLALGANHFRFATSLDRNWRQQISRLYYGAYNTARGVHLHHSGHYSRHSSDHGKVTDLPSDFPDRERFGNQLETLRQDRNLADYDHTATISDLILSPTEAQSLVNDFIQVSHSYLRDRGLDL